MGKLNELIKVEIIKSVRNPNNHVSVSIFFVRFFFGFQIRNRKYFAVNKLLNYRDTEKKTQIFHPKL